MEQFRRNKVSVVSVASQRAVQFELAEVDSPTKVRRMKSNRLINRISY